ncbi:MAG: hypothetical protein P1U74_07270 [Legionellaceae bacterium]|nr:hypothetical protein [Legionellaceae bacterium]
MRTLQDLKTELNTIGPKLISISYSLTKNTLELDGFSGKYGEMEKTLKMQKILVDTKTTLANHLS